MTKHTAHHAAHHAAQIANPVSVATLAGYVSDALQRLVNLRASAAKDARLPAAIRYDIGEDDCRPAPRKQLKAQQSSAQRSLDTMRMRSF